MTTLFAFTIQLIVLACAPFHFARQSNPIRSTSFYSYLSVLLVLANYAGFIYSFPITENINIPGSSLLYCAFMMTTVLFVIIENNVGILRGIIRLVISVNLFTLVLSFTIAETLSNPETQEPFTTAIDIFNNSLVTTSIGGLLTIVELISLIFLFELIKSRIKNVLTVSVLYIATFILVLYLDGLFFPLLLNSINSHRANGMEDAVAGNVILAFAYGTSMLFFLALFRKQLVEYISHPLLLGDLIAAPRRKLIDEIERKNQSLELSHQKYRHLAESIDDVFFSMDKDLRCTYWNKAAETSGFKAEDMIGKFLFDMFPEPEVAPLLLFYQGVLNSGKPGQTECVIPAQGQDRDYEISAYPSSTGLSVLVKDITERKEMEAQLLQSQRMESIGLLAGSIAHDFNNLLVPITAHAELGMMHLAPDDKAQIHLKRVTEAAEQAAGLTRQILAFSRKQVLQMQVLDLNTVVMEYGSMIQRLIGEDIKIKIILDPCLRPVGADRGQIEQVLLNLVVNARDAMPSGGTLTIETANITLDKSYAEQHGDRQPAGNYSLLMISDTGHGMDSDTKKNVFEPFFTTKTQGKGTGLGLATVYGIVKQHHGHIWVDSQTGRGSTFTLYLHQVERSLHIPEKKAAVSNPKGGTETILLVEDGKMVRSIVREGLETYGYTVLEAQNVADGLRLASTNDKIDLLLTDVMMPDMNGRELYEKVVALQPAMSVLFISGYTDDFIVDQGILEDGVNFLQKPFSIVSLLQKVRSCLKQDKELEPG